MFANNKAPYNHKLQLFDFGFEFCVLYITFALKPYTHKPIPCNAAIAENKNTLINNNNNDYNNKT